MARKATIRDVSLAAHVSVTTVSRYLNGSIRLPAETIQRIDDAVKALRYTPNPLARSLSRGKSETIGLVIPEIANPFFARLAASVEATAAERGYGVLLCVTLNNVDREIDYIRRIESKQVDGVLFSTNHPDDGRLLDALKDVPCFVLVDEDIAGADVPGVFAENRGGALEATRHIVEAGHRKIAMLSGPKKLLSAEERRLGFLDAIQEAGPGHDAVAIFDCAYTVEAGEAAAENLLRDHPETTAVFTGSDELFLGMLKVFRRHGVRIGDDISVVTCDDVEPLALFEPAITALRQDLPQMGRQALDLLISTIAGKPVPERHILVPMELMKRDSVRPPRRRARLR
ncbi:LacI family DNA-binding transcriptional regulator [Acidisoma silvae]|uniref:LacI family DNA-binding transcriptional regulator n=1 Tax=Acidisoma silvae TaxID=2802396 RepID=A0A963YTK9_9PROT|nr:LacI family DNA-binding transcriptional regulator [Acidisoma silvae]MCB8876817.1 LacI family DNA-binding transcriptional regulator [Acidisoma silvae]